MNRTVLHSYLSRGYELDHAVFRQYRLADPLELVMSQSGRSPFSAMHRIARFDGMMRVAGMIAAALVFAACVTIYVSYQPYAERFSQFASTGNPVDFRALQVFYYFIWLPANIGHLWNGSVIQFYFWWILLGASVLALAAILFRRLAPAAVKDA